MTFDLWLTFVAATAAFLLIPGPTVLLVLSDALVGDRLRRIVKRPGVLPWITRAGGGTLVAMGLLTATLRRSTT